MQPNRKELSLSSRKEALAKGQKTYFTGKPCSRGHIDHRYVADWCCVSCKKVRAKTYKATSKYKESSKLYYQSPRGRFMQAKNHAKQRGIEWKITFKEWNEMWGEKFEFRGKGADQLCMARFNDEGPYAPNNCYITTNAENTIHYRTGDYPERLVA